MAELIPDDPEVELLPPDDDAIDDDRDLELAAASAISDPSVLPVTVPPPEPYGMTWVFDFEREAFVRRGARPAEVVGLDSLRVWIETCIHTARGAFDAIADDAGMVDPDDPIGTVNPTERAADYTQRMREALLLHDRIADVSNFDSLYDPTSGIFAVNFDVTTDDDEVLDFNTSIQPVTEP